MIYHLYYHEHDPFFFFYFNRKNPVNWSIKISLWKDNIYLKCRVAYFITSLMGRPNCKSESDRWRAKTLADENRIHSIFLSPRDKQRWSLCNFHCANVDSSAEKHDGPWIFHIQAVSFPSREKGVRDPRNVHVLRGISHIYSLFLHLTWNDSPEFHVVTYSIHRLNHRWPSEIRLQEMAWRGIGEDSHRLQCTVRQIEHLVYTILASPWMIRFFPFYLLFSFFSISCFFFLSVLLYI